MAGLWVAFCMLLWGAGANVLMLLTSNERFGQPTRLAGLMFLGLNAWGAWTVWQVLH